MHAPPTFRPLALIALAGLAAFAGCGPGPSKANILLRKQNQDLRDQIGDLERRNAAAEAQIRGLRDSVPTVATLPQDRLAALFTTHEIRIGRLSGGADTDGGKPGDEALKVYVTLFDQTGGEFKASGSFLVEAFDLSKVDGVRVGRWEVSPEEAAKGWNGFLLNYEYVLTLPWQTPPTQSELTVKVTFTDSLTGRRLTAQRPVKVNPPGGPAAAPETARSPTAQ